MSERTEERERTADRATTEAAERDDGGLRDRLGDLGAGGLRGGSDDSPADTDGVAAPTESAATEPSAVGDVEATESESSESSSAVSGRLAGAFSLQYFLLTLGLATVAALGLGAVLPWARLGTLLGVFLASAAVGVLGSARHYVEATAAGALTGGAAMVLGSLLATLVTFGAPAAFGVGAGALVALLGHYAGRDLRDGLQRDL